MSIYSKTHFDMKQLLIISALLFSGMLKGQEAPQQTIRTENVNIQLTEDSTLQINLDIVLPKDLKISTNRMMTFTPVLRNSGGETVLSPVYVYGRKRQILNKRNNRLPLEGSQIVRRTNRKEQTIGYTAGIPYMSWMKGAEVVLEKDLCGCGNHLEENSSQPLAQPVEPMVATPAPVPPEKKKRLRRSVYEGKAFIDFPVNKTVIYPTYRRNPSELARIDSTLEKIGIMNVSRITLHGYASPESPYNHNDFLAKGRTQALKQYIVNKYDLNDSIFVVNHTPEDWEGFIQFAEACDWPEKEQILKIARSDAQPDEKERQLRRLVNAYIRMSREWFPALRHSDYRIEFNEIIEEEE